ncbi:MAG: AsmA family protein [Planctomycetes bacterium]|nr:AsmA family protein [Planctomycetota bacterium]
MVEPSAPARPSATRKHPKRRRFAIFLGVVLVIAVLLVVFLPYIVPTSWLASITEQSLQAALKRPVTLGEVSWGWLSGMRIENVTVSELEDFGGGEFLSIPRISFNVHLVDLLRKKVTVESVTIESPRIVIVRAADGTLNVENIARKRRGPAPITVASLSPGADGALEVSVREVRIKGGRITFKDIAKAFTLEAAEVNAHILADFSKPSITGSADLSADLLQPGGNGRIVLAAENFQVDKCPSRAALEAASASGTLTVDGVEVADVIAAAAPQLGRSLLSGRTSIKTAYEFGEGKVRLKGENGGIKNLIIGLGGPVTKPVEIGDTSLAFDVEGSFVGVGRGVRVQDLQVKTAFADVSLSGAFDETAGILKAHAKASGTLDPSQMPAGLVRLPEGLVAEGRLSFDIEAEGAPRPGAFAVRADARRMHLTYGGTLEKKPGTAAAFEIAGEVTEGPGTIPEIVTIEKITLSLSGGTLSASTLVNTRDGVARWKGLVDLEAVNLADYVATGEEIICTGRVEHSGAFFVSVPKRTSSFAVDTRFDAVGVDIPSRPGREIEVQGAISVNAERALAEDLVITLAGSPLVVEALVKKPLARPTGTVTIRGGQCDVDDLLVLGRRLAAALPQKEAASTKTKSTTEPQSPTMAKPAVTPTKLLAAKARTAAAVYLGNADVNLDLVVDKVAAEGFQGEALSVDAGLVGGRLLVRNAGVKVFGGNVRLTADADLLAPAVPANISFTAAAVEAREPVRRLLAKFVPGLDFSGTLDLSFETEGRIAGPSGESARSFSGRGTLDIAEGVLALTELPAGLSAVLPKDLDLRKQVFSRLHADLTLSDGLLKSECLIPKKDYTIFIEAATSLEGDFTETVGIIPGGSTARVRVVASKNGRFSFVSPKDLIGDLAKSGIAEILRKRLAPGGEEPSKKKQVLDVVEDLIGILQRQEKSKDK